MGSTRGTETRPSVLIVEDERETADLYTEFLAEEYTVQSAYSGEEALEVVDEDVAVVLLDRKMPGMSGDEVLKTIRARNLDCRVVMITAVEPDIEVLDLQFDDYLIKPVSREKIRKVVSSMLVRSTCDETIQEVIALCSKMATIESKLSIPELEASPEYAAVEARFSELRAEADLGHPTDDVYTEFTVEKIRELFSRQARKGPIQ
jgi:DNA-binding response OmpR family regulator